MTLTFRLTAPEPKPPVLCAISFHGPDGVNHSDEADLLYVLGFRRADGEIDQAGAVDAVDLLGRVLVAHALTATVATLAPATTSGADRATTGRHFRDPGRLHTYLTELDALTQSAIGQGCLVSFHR